MARVRKNWTAEEDALLRKLVNSEIENSRPLLWRELAKKIPGRSNKDCRKRWWNSLANSTAKGPWSQAEDKRLIKAVWEHGTNWNEVARIVGTRYADQCSSHWSQVLDPDINHCDWTSQEDEQLLHAVLSHGTTWSTIAASHRPKRTTLALKNRYNTLRLRHQNATKGNKSPSSKAPSTPSIKGLSKRKPKNGQDDGDHFAGNGDTEDEEDDEEEDEGRDGEVDEDIDEEEQENEGTVERTFNHLPLGTYELADNKGAPNSNPNTVGTLDIWTGHTGVLNESIDQWVNVAMNDQTMYMNIDPQLYPGEDILDANRDTSGLDMSLVFSKQESESLQKLTNTANVPAVDADAMKIDFDNLQHSFPDIKSSNNGNPLMPLTCITPSATLLPGDDISRLGVESLEDTNLLPVKDGERNAAVSHGPLYHISITMACKSDQLGDVMTWVTTTGLACDVKIKSRA